MSSDNSFSVSLDLCVITLPETGVLCVCVCVHIRVHMPICASTSEHSANLLHSCANKISYWKKMNLA